MGTPESPAPIQTVNSSANELEVQYHNCIKQGELRPDSEQALIIRELQRVYDELLATDTASEAAPKHKRVSLFGLFSANNRGATKPLVKGLYLWGGVGRGKTHMVDFFYQALPISRKSRLHFHRFMQLVHEELTRLGHIQDPLRKVAEKFAADARLLVLDEMHVEDITDAMLLGHLFQYLFEEGVTLVTTSNVHPQNLYKDGLQRDRFIPAIRLLEEKTRVYEIAGDTDYRLKTLSENGIWLKAGGEVAEQRMLNYFNSLAPAESHQQQDHIFINKREIAVKKCADTVVWIDFSELCNTPRSKEDYLQIARFFHTVMISDIPVMDCGQSDAVRRFINLVDTFYDRNVKIVISAHAEPDQLYIGTKLKFAFERTISRLHEMQSRDYISKQHLAQEF